MNSYIAASAVTSITARRAAMPAGARKRDFSAPADEGDVPSVRDLKQQEPTSWRSIE
jgi:hypothetical protein